MSSLFTDRSTLEIIGIGVFTLFVVYPILMRFVLGIFSFTTDPEDTTTEEEQ